MTNKFLTIFIFLICANCQFRTKLDKPVHLSYSSAGISVELEIISRSRKFSSGPESWYSYYGIMTSQLYSKEKPNKAFLKSLGSYPEIMDLNLYFEKDPNKIFLIYKNKKSEIYLDTIADNIGFWNRSKWNSNGFRKDKIYVAFEDPDVDWNQIKFIETDSSDNETN
jgi:hypothetical protein